MNFLGSAVAVEDVYHASCFFPGLGAGYCYMRVVERFVRGVWTPSSHEILQPSL